MNSVERVAEYGHLPPEEVQPHDQDADFASASGLLHVLSCCSCCPTRSGKRRPERYGRLTPDDGSTDQGKGFLNTWIRKLHVRPLADTGAGDEHELDTFHQHTHQGSNGRSAAHLSASASSELDALATPRLNGVYAQLNDDHAGVKAPSKGSSDVLVTVDGVVDR